MALQGLLRVQGSKISNNMFKPTPVEGVGLKVLKRVNGFGTSGLPGHRNGYVLCGTLRPPRGWKTYVCVVIVGLLWSY